MVENKWPFAEGASINRPPMFGGVNYQFWKVRMKIFIDSISGSIWDAIINGPFILKHMVNNEFVEKPWFDWPKVVNKKAQYYCM